MVRTDLYEASGMSAEEVERLFTQHAALRPENVAEAVESALSLPPDVQVNKILVLYAKETSFCSLIFGSFFCQVDDIMVQAALG